MRKAIRFGNPKIRRFSDGCFTGKYPTPEVTPKLLRDLGSGRNETRDNFDKHYSLGPQNIRDAQQRSQMFRENRQVLGTSHYVDEDLLFEPTYNSVAL
jgi:hypothetical protein